MKKKKEEALKRESTTEKKEIEEKITYTNQNICQPSTTTISQKKRLNHSRGPHICSEFSSRSPNFHLTQLGPQF